MTNYRIEAALFKLPIPFFKRFGHCFWILKESESNKIVAALHGLATSRRTGRILPIGFSSSLHSLNAHHLAYDENFCLSYHLSPATFFLPVSDSQVVYEGRDVLEKWFRAANVIPTINALNLDYPSLGFKFNLKNSVNSNSIYHTLGKVMQVEIFRFPRTILIGIGNTIECID